MLETGEALWEDVCGRREISEICDDGMELITCGCWGEDVERVE